MIVMDTVTSGSALKGEIILRSIGEMLRTAVGGRLGRMPDSQFFDAETGNQKVPAPEANEERKTQLTATGSRCDLR